MSSFVALVSVGKPPRPSSIHQQSVPVGAVSGHHRAFSAPPPLRLHRLGRLLAGQHKRELGELERCLNVRFHGHRLAHHRLGRIQYQRRDAVLPIGFHQRNHQQQYTPVALRSSRRLPPIPLPRRRSPIIPWPSRLFNESSTNPANGGVLAYDVAGGFTGIYQVSSENGTDGV